MTVETAKAFITAFFIVLGQALWKALVWVVTLQPIVLLMSLASKRFRWDSIEEDFTEPSPPKASPDAKFAPLEPTSTTNEPYSVKKPTLTQLCTYMRDFEGLPGDANYRNNNPLNCKYHHGGYLPMYEPVRISPAGFAIFKDYKTGWTYGFNMIKNKIKNHPDWTLYDLIENHAPASDNNPVKQYATFVAKRLSVDIRLSVRDIVLV